MNKSRVEAFSDGVFAFAITLLVVTLAEPDDYSHLAHDLARRWPSLAAYVVSFAVIGIMWLNHHSVFGRFSRVDRGLVYLNLLLLMTVAFLPFPTGVLGQALAQRTRERTAAVVYAVTMTANGCAWAALWLYASRHRRLLRSELPRVGAPGIDLLFTMGAVIYAALDRRGVPQCLRFPGPQGRWPSIMASTRCRGGPGWLPSAPTSRTTPNRSAAGPGPIEPGLATRSALGKNKLISVQARHDQNGTTQEDRGRQ